MIPGLRTRRAKTGVELRDGQSFALAGLLDNSETQSLSKVPGLGDIPILGNLFKSKQFQKNESELMFIVTAQMVKPVNRDDLPAFPNVENLKKGSLLGVDRKPGDIDGPSGFSTNPTGTVKSENSAQPTAPTKTVTAPTGSGNQWEDDNRPAQCVAGSTRFCAGTGGEGHTEPITEVGSFEMSMITKETDPRRNGERGSVIIMTAISMVFLFLLVGLCIDVSRIYMVRAELQNAADAAALTAARELNAGAGGIDDAVIRANAVVNTEASKR